MYLKVDTNINVSFSYVMTRQLDISIKVENFYNYHKNASHFLFLVRLDKYSININMKHMAAALSSN